MKPRNVEQNGLFFQLLPPKFTLTELQNAYEQYLVERNWNLASWGTYEIYNFTSEDVYNKYKLDVFEVYYEKSSYYFVKHNDDVYQISPFDLFAEAYVNVSLVIVYIEYNSFSA